MIPESSTDPKPMRNMETATSGEFPKTAPANKLIMGIFAPQGIKQVVMMVIFLACSCSMVREDRIPGTPQPEATSMGMTDLPERPNLRKTRSRINATRDK